MRRTKRDFGHKNRNRKQKQNKAQINEPPAEEPEEDAVEKSDLTIIGCSGCTHELFDNSATMQTEYHENIMQETCVTVTWMRVLRRLYDLTGDAKYINRFEISAYNALYGSLNTEMNKQWNMFEKKYYEPGAFDSYSPLYMNTRGRGIGGQMCFASGGYGGCCLAIGACGIAPAVTINGKVYPKVNVTQVPKIVDEYRAMRGAEE